jgi:hypothetical protein
MGVCHTLQVHTGSLYTVTLLKCASNAKYSDVLLQYEETVWKSRDLTWSMVLKIVSLQTEASLVYMR